MNLLHLNPKDLSSHIGIYGDTGSGKTSFLKQYLMEVEKRGDVAVVMDPDREFARAFRSEKRGDWILDPGVMDCPYWHIGDEARDEAEAIALATCLFPDNPNNRDPYWTTASRRLFAYLLAYYRPTTAELGFWMAHDAAIDLRIKGTEFERMLTNSSPQQRAGVISHMNLAAQPLRMMPSQPDGRRQFTVRDYCQRRDSWVFVTSKPSYADALRPLQTMWVASFIMRVIDMGHRADLPRVHFIFEEAGSLIINEFHLALVRLRKTQSPVVFAIQNFSDLRAAYGDKAETIFSQPFLKVLFRTSNPDSAKKLEATVGMKKTVRCEESRSWGRNGYTKSWAMREKDEPVIATQEIMNWPDREGVLLQPGVAVRIKVPIVDLPDRLPLIEERAIPPMEHRPLETAEVQTSPVLT